MDRKMTKEEFDNWVNEICTRYHNDSSVSIARNDDYTFVFKINDMKKVGMSKCHPEDKYSCVIGLAIAYARCIGEEVPKIYKTICEQLEKLKYNEQFIFREQRYIYMCQHPVFSEFEIVCYEINTGKFVEFPRELVVEKIKED